MAFEYEVINSRLVAENSILALRRDEVTMPDGTTSHREIVEHFGAVAIVAYDGNNIAMVRQYRHAVKTRLWELPAGLLDIANEDPLVCAQRELKEEAGIGARNWAVLVDGINSPGFCDEAVRIYLATDLFSVQQPNRQHEELDMENEWVPLVEAVEMVMNGKIHNLTAVAGIMCANNVLSHNAQPREYDCDFALRPTALSSRRQAQGLLGDMKQVVRD
ncbi:NTP pyrophosphohydrolase [Corynebacterium mustelae]|uniref:NTP pyrophosphohydrolase n=1 Tax=Corynebacterium mustelae TaxID=571915 RepID=A0A0G3H216_9CORY|nr:NUDIX hydrolase [Corynebacterium mustelae]AKK05868.1 NTP pyrophosphohydrolase [Corynebacterium mustelae]